MERETAIEWLETASNGMEGDLGDALRMGAEAIRKNIPEDESGCSGGACAIHFPDEIKIKYHADITHIEQVDGSDWIDLRSAEDVTMVKGDYRKISLGVSMKLPEGHEAHIAPRSSSYERYGIKMVGSGVIDESYCGDSDIWHFAVVADRNTIIPKNERICQFRIVEKQPKVQFSVVDNLGYRNRGGFGSTGRT